MISQKKKPSFSALNAALTNDVVERLQRAGRHGFVLAEAPPGAGKSTLTASVANALVEQDGRMKLAVVTQTKEQADDLVTNIVRRYPSVEIARLCGGTSGPSPAIRALGGAVAIGDKGNAPEVIAARIVVATARKWQYERSRMQTSGSASRFPIALIDEAYQMRSDALLGIADLFPTLFCVGDPGQLDPFTTVDDALWKGLPHSPSRSALATLRSFHPDIEPLRLPTSWRLPPSAVGVVASAFYPNQRFEAGTVQGQRAIELGRGTGHRTDSAVDLDGTLRCAATRGWAYVELPERFTIRTDSEVAHTLAALVDRLIRRGASLWDEMNDRGTPLESHRVAVVTAHNDQVQAVRYALDQLGRNHDGIVVSTANKIQGREYDVVFVWHPLAGRRDATAFHLEAGRMCVMLSRHRHACIVVGRAGAERLLEEFPDSDPVFLDEPEKFPDGWEANHAVLRHLAKHRVD